MTASIEFDFRICPESVASWMIGRDGQLGAPPRPGDQVPLSYLVFLRAQPILGISIHEALARDPERGLYGGVRYRAERSLRVGEALSVAGNVADRREVDSPRGRMVITTLDVDYSADGARVARESVRMIDLPARDATAAAEETTEPRMRPSDLNGFDCIATVAPITRRQVSWMTVATGDLNELHFDAEHARRRGYSDIVVPAPLISALIEREVAKALARPLGALDCRYLAPTYPGESLKIHARRDGQSVELKVCADTAVKVEGRAFPIQDGLQ